MKQIKDVDVLKDMIRGIPISMSNIVKVYLEKKITEIIDSLAVEVPEVKPGAIEEAIQICEQSRAESIRANSSFSTASIDRIIRNARAELVQLQTEIAEAEGYNGIAHDMLELQEENKNLKGALRTLANIISLDCECCPLRKMDDDLACYCGLLLKQNAKQCREAVKSYAIANPTEEVEG